MGQKFQIAGFQILTGSKNQDVSIQEGASIQINMVLHLGHYIQTVRLVSHTFLCMI